MIAPLLRFSRGTGIAGAVVRWYTASDYAHVGFWLGDGWVLDACPGYGVSRRRQSLLPGDALYEIDAPPEDMAIAMAWAWTQIGKGYDYKGVLGIGLHERDWRDPTLWWCSEYCAGAMDQTRSPLVNGDFLYRVSPQDVLQSPRIRFLRVISA